MLDQKRTLSLHPRLDTHPVWQAHTTAITEFDPEFYKRPLGIRVAITLHIARNFRQCVLYGNDIRFVTAVGLILKTSCTTRLSLVEAYPPIVSSKRILSPKYFAYRILFGLMDIVFVHSSFEVREFSRFFDLPESHFRFVPYFPYYEENLPDVPQWDVRWNKGYVLCPGRHRDLRTFVRAAAMINRQCAIIAGADDIISIKSISLPPNVEIHSELSEDDYYEKFARAALIVLPFFKERYLRSLGHIAYFESARYLIPVITSRSPHLSDYTSEKDVIWYDPEEPMDLARSVRRLLSAPDAAKQLAQNARAHITQSFSRDKYVLTILDLIN